MNFAKFWGLLLLCLGGVVGAQNIPNKTITLLVPTTSGSGSDIVARLVAPKLSKALSSPVIVDNKTGASGTIAITTVANSTPDGTTVLVVPNTMAMISAIYKNLPWNPATDFSPVARVGKMPVALVVNPSVGANTLEELVAYCKAKPGVLNFGTPGSGTPHHLRTEMFKQMTGINIVHVPYKGSSGAVTDLVGGQVQVGFFPLHSVLSMVATGKLKMLATSGEVRSQWTPNVPTFRESGIKDLNDYDWVGVFLPKATPSPIVSKLSREFLLIINTPETQAELAQHGIIANPGGPEEMGSLLKKELAEWKKTVDEGHITAD
jgi:tripartite-type tricarboxylate transporter receptor subunit TctC